MSKVWYIRHGESESNVKGIFAGGQDDTPLTENGRLQAKKAASHLKSAGITTIVTSTLSRTRETALIIAKELDIDADGIQEDARLVEYDVGSGNGKSYEGMNAQQLVSFEGAEDPDKFQERVKSALLSVKQMNGIVLIVAHGGVGRLIHCMQDGGDPKSFYDYPKYPNAEPVELDLEWLK